eukprot:COSAG02_NODE_52879_length_305_cov_0.757282_1_plen_66_part_01
MWVPASVVPAWASRAARENLLAKDVSENLTLSLPQLISAQARWNLLCSKRWSTVSLAIERRAGRVD